MGRLCAVVCCCCGLVLQEQAGEGAAGRACTNDGRADAAGHFEGERSYKM